MAESLTIRPRKYQIQETAQNLFREKGYAATSMRDLAREVGIEPASLYSHIRSKSEILKNICFGMADQFFLAIERVDQENNPPDEKARQAIIAHLRVVRENIDAATVFFHDWHFLDKPDRKQFKSYRKNYERYFREILKSGVHQGIFKPLNINVILPTLFSAMNWSYEWYRPSVDLTPEEVGNEIYNILFNGIKKQ